MTDYSKMFRDLKSEEEGKEAAAAAERTAKIDANNKRIADATQSLREHIRPLADELASSIALDMKIDIEEKIPTPTGYSFSRPELIIRPKGPIRKSDGYQFKARAVHISADGASFEAKLELQHSSKGDVQIGVANATAPGSVAALMEKSATALFKAYMEEAKNWKWQLGE